LISIADQTRALIWLRVTLSLRRIARRREWGRLVLSVLSLLLGLAVSCGVAAAVWMKATELGRAPGRVEARGGAVAIFATWLAGVLLARIWFALLPRGQSGALFDPRRFLAFAFAYPYTGTALECQKPPYSANTLY